MRPVALGPGKSTAARKWIRAAGSGKHAAAEPDGREHFSGEKRSSLCRAALDLPHAAWRWRSSRNCRQPIVQHDNVAFDDAGAEGDLAAALRGPGAGSCAGRGALDANEALLGLGGKNKKARSKTGQASAQRKASQSSTSGILVELLITSRPREVEPSWPQQRATRAMMTRSTESPAGGRRREADAVYAPETHADMVKRKHRRGEIRPRCKR